MHADCLTDEWEFWPIIEGKFDFFDQMPESTEFHHGLIGGALMYLACKGNENKNILFHAWIHPFYRGKGRMTALVQKLVDKYDPLYYEGPLKPPGEALVQRFNGRLLNLDNVT
jgi:GNAT superfamily N-acetyltransferase